MSSKKSYNKEIVTRVLELSSSYATNKAFLEICDISNHSFITDLKKGRIKNPSGAYLAQIVRGTGCSGTWLLTGQGEMYPPRENDPALAAEPAVKYQGKLMHALRLIAAYDLQPQDFDGMKLPDGLALQFAKLTALLLEQQHGGKKG